MSADSPATSARSNQSSFIGQMKRLALPSGNGSAWALLSFGSNESSPAQLGGGPASAPASTPASGPPASTGPASGPASAPASAPDASGPPASTTAASAPPASTTAASGPPE